MKNIKKLMLGLGINFFAITGYANFNDINEQQEDFRLKELGEANRDVITSFESYYRFFEKSKMTHKKHYLQGLDDCQYAYKTTVKAIDIRNPVEAKNQEEIAHRDYNFCKEYFFYKYLQENDVIQENIISFIMSFQRVDFKNMQKNAHILERLTYNTKKQKKVLEEKMSACDMKYAMENYGFREFKSEDVINFQDETYNPLEVCQLKVLSEYLETSQELGDWYIEESLSVMNSSKK